MALCFAVECGVRSILVCFREPMLTTRYVENLLKFIQVRIIITVFHSGYIQCRMKVIMDEKPRELSIFVDDDVEYFGVCSSHR